MLFASVGSILVIVKIEKNLGEKMNLFEQKHPKDEKTLKDLADEITRGLDNIGAHGVSDLVQLSGDAANAVSSVVEPNNTVRHPSGSS